MNPPQPSPPRHWQDLVQPGTRVVAAVSGGADSCLMAMKLAEAGAALTIVHVNHHLYPGLSDEDAAFVVAFARQHNWPVIVRDLHDEELRADPAASTSLEARLRDRRHEILREEARRVGAQVIALGHTATDRAETFLLMALRAAGPRGLGSMGEVRQVDDAAATWKKK